MSDTAARRLFRNTLAYMAAGLAPNVINLVILPVYTRYLEPADYGQVALVVSVTTFLGAFLGLQLANSIARMYFDYEGEARARYIGTVLSGMLLANVFLLLPVHLTGPWWAARIFPRVDLPYQPLLALGLGLVFCQNLVNFGNALLRVQERGRALLTASLAHTLCSVGLGVWLIVFRGAGARGLLLSMLGGTFVHVLFQGVFLRRSLKLHFDSRMFRQSAAYSLPMIPHSLGGMLFMYSDKYVAALFVSVAAVGLYEFADKISMVFKMMVLSFHHAISPNFMRDSREDREATRQKYAPLISRWTAVYGWLLLAMSLVAKEGMGWVFPERFAAAHLYLPVLMGAYLVQGLYGFALDAILYEKQTRWVPVITFSAGLLNVLLNMLLIPRYGIYAAAWTTLASFFLCFAMAWGLTRRFYPLIFQWRTLLGTLGMLILFLIFGLNLPVESTGLSLLLKCGLILLYGLFLWVLNPGNLREWGNALLHASRVSNLKDSPKDC